ncbi:MAG: inactive transglutaminase family protein [Endozoicomonas sp.]
MKGRFQLSLAVVFFIAAGMGLTLYKHFVLGFPLVRGETTTLWSIEAQIEFTAEDGPAKATLTLPDNQSGVRILDESFASPGFGINQFEEQGQRRAEWSIREASGNQSLFYKVQLYPEITAPPATDSEADPENGYGSVRQSLPQPYQTAAESLVRQVTEKSADAKSFAGTLISEFTADSPGQNTNMLLGMADSRGNRTRMLIRLLEMADIPVRLVRGLYLEDGRRRQPMVDMLEVLTDSGWLMFDPETGRSGNPDNFFLWQRGGKSLLDVMGGRNSRVRFSMISQAVPARDMAIRTSRADEATLIDFSIYALPLEVQNAFKSILLVPIGTLVVLVMRILVGLRTSGTFMPVLIAVAFLETQLIPGLVIFITIVSIGLWLRSILSQLNMLLVARLAAVMIVVIGIMGVMSIFSWKLGITQALTVTFFPMIILAWTIERMSILWEEEGPKDVLIEGFGSLLVATISYLFMSNPTVEHLTFNFPELLLAVLGVTLMLGQYTGYRLLELRRFKPLVERAES